MVKRLADTLDMAEKHGFPNYFGSQRFGFVTARGSVGQGGGAYTGTANTTNTGTAHTVTTNTGTADTGGIAGDVADNANTGDFSYADSEGRALPAGEYICVYMC